MVDFIAYIAPGRLINMRIEGSYAFVKHADHYTLYTHKDLQHWFIIYYPENPDFKKIKDIYPQDYIFKEIKCAFESVMFKDIKIDPNSPSLPTIFKGANYSKNQNDYQIIYDNSCLTQLKYYVLYKLRLGSSVEKIFERYKNSE